MYYSDLGDNAKADFLQYTISSLLLIDLPDGDILNMFARLNTYSVKLNNQELLNSQYFGYYKQLVYRLASEYGTFWIDNKILSEKAMSRMDDAKFISDIMLTIVSGDIISNTMAMNERYHKRYDDEFPQSEIIEQNIKKAIDLLDKLYEGALSETSFKQIPLLYSTILVLYHMYNPIDCFIEFDINYDDRIISRLKTALDEIDTLVAEGGSDDPAKEAFILTFKKIPPHLMFVLVGVHL